MAKSTNFQKNLKVMCFKSLIKVLLLPLSFLVAIGDFCRFVVLKKNPKEQPLQNSFPTNPVRKKTQKRKHQTQRFLFNFFVTLILTIQLSGLHLLFHIQPAIASGPLSIEPLTWDIIGLDSNNPNDGPDKFLVGARVCNLSTTTAAQNLRIRFVREGAFNPLISVSTTGLYKDQWLVPSLPPSTTSTPPLNHHQQTSRPKNCFDAYYVLTLTRTSDIYNRVQRYRIEAFADNAATVDTNSYPDPYQGTINEYDTGHPRQIYIEKILSQARNSVTGFTQLAPTTAASIFGINANDLDTASGGGSSYSVEVGGTYAFELTTRTATAYPQLTVSSDFPNAVFQILDVQTDYSNVGGNPDNSSIYANACGWISDPTVTGYLASSSVCEYETVALNGTPDQYPSTAGKVGNTVRTRYLFKILGGNGNYTINHLILDFSGGSFHYNGGFGSGLGVVDFNVTNPSADLVINKSHIGNFTPGDNIYTFQVTNNGLDTARSDLVITDTLPQGFIFNPSNSNIGVESQSGTIVGWTCIGAGTRNITCANPNDLANGGVTTLSIRVNVAETAAANTFNQATVSSPTTDPNLANNTDIDPTSIIQATNLKLTKADSSPDAAANPASNNAPVVLSGSPITYTFTVQNQSSLTAAAPVIITDTLPEGLTFSLADNPNIPTVWNCTIDGQNLTCTYVSGTNPIPLPGNTTATALPLVFRANGGVITSGTSAVVRNTATVTSATTEANSSDNTSSDDFLITLPVSDLTITKNDFEAAFTYNLSGQTYTGENLTYEIAVRNNGVAPTVGPIAITETLPNSNNNIIELASTTFAGVGPDGSVINWTCNQGINNPVLPASGTTCAVGNSGLFTFVYPGTLNPGQTATLRLIVRGRQTNTVPGTSTALINTVGVYSANDGVTQSKTATESTPVLIGNNDKYNIGIRKQLTQINGVTPSPACTLSGGTSNYGTTESCTATVSPGNPIQYTVTVANNNNGGPNGVNVAISDFIPPEINITGVTCSATGSQGQTLTVCDNQVANSGRTSPIAVNFNLVPNTNPPRYQVDKTAFLNKGTGIVTYTFTGSIKTLAQLQALGIVNSNIVNRVSAPKTDGTFVDTDSNDNLSSTSIRLNVTDLSITKTDAMDGTTDPGTTNFTTGGEGVYTLRVNNLGTNATVDDINVVDDVPDRFQVLEASGTNWNCLVENPTPANPISNPAADSINNNIVRCARSTAMAAGTSSTIRIRVKPIATWIPAGTETLPLSFNNIAQVTTTGDTNTANNGYAPGTTTGLAEFFGYEQTLVVAPNFDLKVTKSVPGGSFAIGQTSSYRLDILNNGPTEAIASTTNPITVTDTLPTGFTFISGTGSGWTCTASGQNVTCTRSSNLAAGATTSINLNVFVDGTATNPTSNTAQVNLTGEPSANIVLNDNNSNSRNRHTISTAVQQAADLSITKTLISTITNTSPPPETIPGLVAGEQAVYELEITNNGLSNISDGEAITVIDNLPSNLNFVSGSGDGFSCNASGQAITCTKTNGLTVGQNATITLVVNVNSAATGTITNLASVDAATTPDPNPNNDNSSTTDPVQTRNLDLALTKSHLASSFAIGHQGTYSLEVKNVGNITITNPITITDTLPLELSYNSAVGQGWSCSVTTQGNTSTQEVVTCISNDDLAPGQTNTVDIVVDIGPTTPTGTNSITNSAIVTTPGDADTNNNTDTDPTSITGSADLSVDKAHSGNFTKEAQGVYTLTVKNESASTADATGIQLIDQLPDGLYYVSGTGTDWTCPLVSFTAPGPPTPEDLRDIECSYNGTLTPGATAPTLTITVYVQDTAPSTLENFVTVFGDQPDPNDDNNTDLDRTTITDGVANAPDLILVKRITAVISENNTTNYTVYRDDTSSDSTAANDNAPFWPGYSAGNQSNTFTVGELGLEAKPNDTVEYTIYFLNQGNAPASNIKICDRLSQYLDYSPDAYGSSMGIKLNFNNSETNLTGVADVDAGQFFGPDLTPSGCIRPDNLQPMTAADNPNGTLRVELANVDPATSPATPANSYGYIRFRARVK
ncbi:DUF11 domain-containing protein [Picosynechococcus sp. NKBG042902]|uniref:DUF11 domain-containing protein n=1 Tax=Picosynechococcus sp. NKBG042902 TaxID=490193 RepID=UPI0009FFC125|nr:DUF11 domain-containing protein [Picosynechococcus sp. NKBG042902]